MDQLNCSYLHHAQINKGRLSDEEMEYFFELMKDVAAMVSNDQLYQVLKREGETDIHTYRQTDRQKVMRKWNISLS